jgi:Protein of unknown function DUF86
VKGEAARQVSRDFTTSHPEIPWENIIGMRHKVVHDYLGVDEDIVWQVVTEDPLALVDALLAAQPGNAGWLVPIEPLLRVWEAPDVWAPVLQILGKRSV